MEINRYSENTLCFDVKKYSYTKELESYITENFENLDFEFSYINFQFVLLYTEKLMKKLKKYKWILNYSYEGRNGGWLCINIADINFDKKQKQIGKIETLVNKFYCNFDKEFLKYLNRGDWK